MGSYRLTGGREFCAETGEVRRDGTVTRLEPQPAAVLDLLARRAGEVVTHEDLRRHVWGEDTHVNFQEGLHYCVRQIRAALGDRAQAPQFIVTIPRRGYRLRAEALVPLSPAKPAATAPVSRWRRNLALACLGIALVGAAEAVERRPNNHHERAVAVLTTLHDLIF